MRIKLTLEVGPVEYGIGAALIDSMFRYGDGALYQNARFWFTDVRRVLRLGVWMRRDAHRQAIERLVQIGVKRGLREAAGRLKGLKNIADALEKFAKDAGEQGHGAFSFALMCFSVALDEAAQGLPLDLGTLQSKINSGTAEARRRHEMNLQYAELAKAELVSGGATVGINTTPNPESDDAAETPG